MNYVIIIFSYYIVWFCCCWKFGNKANKKTTRNLVNFLQIWQIMVSDWPSSWSYSASSWLITGSSLTRNGVWPQWTLSGSSLTPLFVECSIDIIILLIMMMMMIKMTWLLLLLLLLVIWCLYHSVEQFWTFKKCIQLRYYLDLIYISLNFIHNNKIIINYFYIALNTNKFLSALQKKYMLTYIYFNLTTIYFTTIDKWEYGHK